MSKGLVLKNVANVDVGNNEFFIPSVVNRVLKKLFDNDVALDGLYKRVFGNAIIKAYSRNSEYSYGDLVWFTSTNKDLYLLRSVYDENRKNPQDAIDEIDSTGTIPFDKYGWNNLNPKIDILKLGIRDMIERLVMSEFEAHSSNKELHRFGKLDDDGVDNHILRSDLSNIDAYRQTNFYPYATERLESNNVILNGIRRIYQNKMNDGNSLIEYDLTFQLGVDADKRTVQHDGVTYNLITANNVKIINDDETETQESGNTAYFVNTDDQTIFRWLNNNAQNFSVIGNTYQANRNGYVNVYSATIEFPPPYFSDTRYMVFTGDVKSQDSNTENHAVVCGTNALTFCNKTDRSITVLLITVPDQDEEFDEQRNISKGGIVANSFHCRIVGKGVVL